LGSYIIRRVFAGIITMILITLAVFILLRLGGGNPVEYMLPPEATQADIEKLTAAYGFDKSIWTQLGIYYQNLFQGDLGYALQWDHRPVVDVVWGRMPATLQLTAAAMVISVVLGVAIGAVSAARPDSILDRVGKVLAITGQSMPVFWVGLLLIVLFTVQLGWLDSAGGFDRLGPKAIVMPAARERAPAACIAGPSAIGSVNGTPISSMSAPAAARRRRTARLVSKSGSPPLTKGANAARPARRSAAKRASIRLTARPPERRRR